MYQSTYKKNLHMENNTNSYGLPTRINKGWHAIVTDHGCYRLYIGQYYMAWHRGFPFSVHICIYTNKYS